MAQHDFIIANDSGANVRADLNNALAAIASNNSGSSEPTTTYAFQWWYDTTNNLLKLRNSANSAWITLPFDPTTSGEVNITANSTATANLAFSGGDVTFGDNDKAIFGAGSDLEIYHSGTDTFIRENGTGNLNIGGSHLVLEDSAGANYIDCVSGGAVYIRHNNITKLETTSTGIDVTGTVTADGLTVNDTIRLDNEDTTVNAGDVLGDIEFYDNDGGSAGAGVTSKIEAKAFSTYGASNLNFYTSSSSGGARTALTQRMQIDGNGDISFYEDTGTTAKFFWDASAESLGIGTTTPANKLHVYTGQNYDTGIRLQGISHYWDLNAGEGGYSSAALNLKYNGTKLWRVTSGTFTTYQSLTVNGTLSKSSGSFRIDHPLPEKTETHHLVHSFVEAPQADNIYRGKVDLVDGLATVNIDTVAGMTEGTFAALNREVQCFTSNESDWDAVRGSVSGNILTIECENTSSTATISWLVIGERQDQHMYDTDWTDENGKVIVEPLKETEIIEE